MHEPAFPTSNYYGSYAPSQPHQPTTSLPADQLMLTGEGAARMVPTFTLNRLSG